MPSAYLVIPRLEISLHDLIPSKSRENKNMVFLMIDISRYEAVGGLQERKIEK